MPISVTASSSPPAADLFLSSLPAGTARVRVWRQWADQEQRVRGDEQASVVGSETRLEDYDLPVGRAVTYRAQCFAIDGSELAPLAVTSPVTVPLADPTTAWVSDPLAPGLAQLLSMAPSDMTRSFDSETVYAQVIGSRDPVSISGVRSSASDFGFTFIALSYEESNAIEALVSSGGVILVRADPTQVRHATGLVYLSAPQVRENRRWDMVMSYPYRSDWDVVGRQCRPPSLSVVMPLREYADVEAEAEDYQGILDLYTDYLALLRG